MKEKNENQQGFLISVLQTPWVKGSLLGSLVLTCITPFIKLTNHTLKGERMPWRNPMSGALALAASAVPNYAITFAVKELLKKEDGQRSKAYDLFTSLASGSASGLACTPFETVSQNKQLTDSKSNVETAKKIMHHHGYQGLFRGASCVIIREGFWAAVFFTAIPNASAALQKQGYEKAKADAMAVLLVAGGNAIFTTPINQLKFRKLQGLTEPGPNKSYWQHVKDIYNQGGSEVTQVKRFGYFYKAWVPRVMTSTCAATVMLKGREAYEDLVNKLSSN